MLNNAYGILTAPVQIELISDGYGADFSLQRDGVCRLNPELAIRVAQLAVEYYKSTADSTHEPR